MRQELEAEIMFARVKQRVDCGGATKRTSNSVVELRSFDPRVVQHFRCSRVASGMWKCVCGVVVKCGNASF